MWIEINEIQNFKCRLIFLILIMWKCEQTPTLTLGYETIVSWVSTIYGYENRDNLIARMVAFQLSHYRFSRMYDAVY